MSNQNRLVVFKPRLLAQSSAHARISASAASIDITEWLFTLPEHEYNNCTPSSGSHITAAFTRSPEGKKMSINVEYIGDSMFVEHYVEDISEPLHCRVKSLSTMWNGTAFSKLQVVWELIAEADGDVESKLTNNVLVFTTEDFEAYIERSHLKFEEVRASIQANLDAHNSEETPEFAASIARTGHPHLSEAHGRLNVTAA